MINPNDKITVASLAQMILAKGADELNSIVGKFKITKSVEKEETKV